MSQSPQRRPQVLVIEDEPLLQRAIALKLEKRGKRVVIAGTADEALKILEGNDRYSAIWLDHYLPGVLNGLDILLRVHNDPRYSQVPVIVVSNTASSDKRAKYLEEGARAFFVKAEHSIDEIVQTVEREIGTH